MEEQPPRRVRTKSAEFATAVASKAAGTVVGHVVIHGWQSLQSNEMVGKLIEGIVDLFN